ncbi:MAG: ATP-dependent DNA helicase [Acidimicrobiia bacterium]|jgi:DNA helicase-2/ATP-dependent DNA helicase PcrA
MRLTPTREQQDILDLGPTSIRVRAGAGTGKTTTVALVIANLVENHGIDPERILGMTFTNKAAAELAERVSQLLPESIDQSRQVEVHTYHGFAAQVLSEFGVLAGVDARSGVITPTFARQMIRDVFLDEPHTHLDMTNRHTLNQIRKLADQLGDHLLRPEAVRRAGEIHDDDDVWAARLEMVETLARYNEAKTELGVVDYADLVTLSTLVLREHPGLVPTIRDRYRVLVLDEYQDTNPAQRVLITTIFGDGFPVIAVGDEDQTIYEWRGASAENFERFLSHFPTGEGTPAHDRGLTLNRRSGDGILHVANEIRRRANPGADQLEAANDIETEIITHWASDALAEAEWIARQFESLHDRGVPWSDMAVLFRKNKDFAIVVDALGRHDIPVEVANVGGLLSVPEISHLRAWLTVLQNPEDSAALSQILFGSGYRLGIGDLAVLTRWLTDNRPDESDLEDLQPITLIEAIEQSDRIGDLSPEARRRLDRFHDVYRDLLVETQGLSLAETCRRILDRTRAWQDVESLPPSPRLTARLNLYRFLDLADDWSPLSGRPSVAAFLDYLDAMEEEPAEELDSARLSGEDAVTLVTVHRAKGLEWANVAIPAVTKGNFPSAAGGYPDPVRFAYHLPVELRLDTTIADLPEDDDGRKALFRQRHYAQEWRVAYVATTRAKERLFVSGAYWYGLPEPRLTAAEPSELFELVETHESSVDAGHSPPGPRPPILRSDPANGAPDPLFDGGWQALLSMGATEPERLDEIAGEAGVASEYRALADATEQRLLDLDLPAPDQPESEPVVVSVTGLVTYAQCPKRYYWSDVDPLPRRRNAAAVRGTEIHRRIELDQKGQVPFEDMSDDLYDTTEADRGASGGFGAYEQSRFAATRATLVEAPFTVELANGYRVRGRIDAVYSEGDHWEIVDFKTGSRREDPSRIVQLQAYAVAAEAVARGYGMAPPGKIEVTFAYLGGGLEEVRTEADTAWISAARDRLESLTDGIDAGDFEPAPGPWCDNCDFLQFCPAGQEEVAR